MGVTGFSMGITSSTANGFSDCAVPPKRRTHFLSSCDGEGGNVTVLGSIGKCTAIIIHIKLMSYYIYICHLDFVEQQLYSNALSVCLFILPCQIN